MQDDITDGVQWLIKEDIADPKRVAIYGGSYGGYATLAGVTLTPDLYAAAVDYVGVSNMFTFMKTIPPQWKPMRNMLYEMVGNPEKDKDFLQAVSPIFLAGKIKTPLFVAQGANDPRVNKAESEQIVEALKRRGVAVEYMLKEDEGHGFRNQENQFEFYEAMERFLAKHSQG
jgi:dipeptidyl aminopeptidase/acylaminoacyl peptidase